VALSARLDREDPGGDYICRITISDTGVGIPGEVQGQLFKKFSQGDTSTTRKFGGTGLGLSISKSLAELMGGTIAFTSQVGKGSAFTVTIPLRKSPQDIPWESGAPAGAAPEPAHDFSNFSILVADDHPVNMLFTRKFLKKMGFTKISEASSGTEALNLLEHSKEKYDLLLMDCQMPGMDGFQLTRAIREIEHGCGVRKIPIIAMTAHAMEGDREKCLAAGMDDYISKPINPDRLERAIARWLNV
jgi:CheY-like chemotaxis protein